MNAVRRYGPGLALLVAVGLAARLLAAAVPGVNHLIVTIILGLVVGNAVGVPEWAAPGVTTHTLWLEVGIVVMGASVPLDRVIAAGPTILLLVVATVTATVLVVELLARYAFGVGEETGSLLAAGSGICGVSAVVAIAESIDADDAAIGYAATTVLLFDATTLFAYPAVGHLLGLSGPVFGVWAGLTMFSTGPVTAAGLAYSAAAGRWALLAKLTRNSLIGVAAVAYAVVYASRGESDGPRHRRTGWGFLWTTFPKFVLGFLGVLVVANFGVLDGAQITSLSHLSNWAFLFAFAGLGLEIDLEDLLAAGYRPILTVAVGFALISTTALLVVQALW